MHTILIVDDRTENLLALEQTLKALDVQIVRAQSGEEALRQSLNHDFALAILDVQMPDMDGYELASFLRQDQHTRRLPIIFLSAVYSDEAHVTMGYEAGAVDFLTKPFLPEVLVSKVRIFLQLAEQRRSLEQEVAQRRQMEARLREAKAAAEAANEAKSLFLANMSHEIRTPLNAVIGMTELVLGTQLAPEQHEYLTLARSSALALLGLLNDILDLSKIEAGKLDIEQTDFDPRAMVEELARTFAPQARAKGLELHTSVAPDLPRVMVGDPARFRQVLFNLLGNAVKFTDRGRIDISLELVTLDGDGQEGEPTYLRCSVADTGAGIAPDRLENIFEPFSQADASITRTHGGTGLGLSICKRLVNLMCGRMTVDSSPGQGSRFTFTVKVGRSSAALPRGDAQGLLTVQPEDLAVGSGSGQGGGQGHTALVVEDNPLNQLLLAKFLEAQGLVVTPADSGAQALEILSQRSFDVIFMDLQMPGMDGCEATAAIRCLESTREARRTPVVAVTAHALASTREQCMKADMDGYIAKPVRPAELVRLLQGLFARPAAEAAACRTLALPEHLAGNPELLQGLKQAFFEQYGPLLDEMAAAVLAGDAGDLVRAAHSLRGSLLVFGHKESVALAEGLETAGRAGQLAEAAPLLSELRTSVSRLVDLLTTCDA